MDVEPAWYKYVLFSDDVELQVNKTMEKSFRNIDHENWQDYLW